MDNITRDDVLHAVSSVFDDVDKFFEIFENDSAGPRFDCVNSVGESCGSSDIYIIDTETKKFIGWYKLYHIGRDFTTNMNSESELYDFFSAFKKESEKWE